MQQQFDILKELSLYRAPHEMHLYFNYVIESLKKDREALKLARFGTGIFKKFNEEFVPAYLFSLSPHCHPASKVKLILGKQGYDFVVKHSSGYEEKFEISAFQEGQRNMEIAKGLNEVGYSHSRLTDYSGLKRRAEHYMYETKQNMLNKAKKDYRGVSLLFSISTFQFFDVLEKEAELSVERLIHFIESTPFQAKAVYLIIDNGHDMTETASKILKVK
ncbi:hypothetical protein EVJ20_13575 [Exiguobacterium sp. SH0S1]|uniref:hypothetical protein n=1 Tax=Exiguobacterium sp. SH0S1 TaxID=2510949 RepID=UPI00103B37EE|nr:hypothetical protein [Exiguobacterium sp. SH0S1]TCI75712.1 hypothetical protein EVJ20_13575 [Exiguobacterium sp. SH0S1]